MNKDHLMTLQNQVKRLLVEGKYQETIKACYTLLEYGIKWNDHKSILVAHLNHAQSFYYIGEIEKAFRSIEAYDEVCREHGDEEDYLQFCNISFLLYEYNKDYDKAKKTLEKSIALGEKLKKYNIVSNGYSNYCHVLITEKNYKKALEMASKGLEMAKLHEPSSRILEIRVELNLALALIGLGDFAASEVLIHQMINDPILDSFIREKSECYDLQGTWYFEQERYKEAFESLTYAKELVETYKDLYLLKDIQEKRCRLCELMGDITLGFEIQKEYILLLHEMNRKGLALTAFKIEAKQDMKDMEKKANTDYLTGLYNRNFLETKTNEWLKLAETYQESIVCIVLDIDNFKSINDEHGHLFGDEVLRQVSKVFISSVRDNDLVGRYGGDEFVLILKGATKENGMKKADQIIEAIGKLKIEKDEQIVRVKVSIGIADNSGGSITHFNELFHLADRGLYKAKQNGKNQIGYELG